MVCVVGRMRDLILQLSKSSIYSTKPTVGSRFWRKFRHEKSWCLHDLRRVLATNLNDMGVDPHVVEQLLGHTLPGVMGIYNRSQYLAAKLDALTRWVDYLNSLIRSDAKEESSNGLC
ncbi:TPA: tyrosine-type recombinase/integrase [Klebsiella pneumoniae]|nr:tyrosine-type recombinase/integrase [Klebsiella pneumoniae]